MILEKPRYITKQAAQIMAQEGKLDLLLKTMEENEKKRAEAEERSRLDLKDLKAAVEARLPQVEKQVVDLHASLGNLSAKVEQMESSLLKQSRGDKGIGEVKEDPFTTSPSPSPSLIHGKRDLTLNTSSPFAFENSTAQFDNMMGPGMVAGSIPSMTCPQFSGENPQMWRANCEVYFDVYGIPPGQWVKVATLNFVGNAAYWLQSVRNQLIGVTWFDLCDRVCALFTKDRQETLVRQWFHIRQTGSVSEYVEKFDCLMHQLLAYEQIVPPVYFVQKFIDGLKDEVRRVVIVQRPQDMDAASSIALLQEEAIEGVKFGMVRKSEGGTYVKSLHKTNSQ